MSKMMKAEVKVVRFGCADVIATSSLVNGRNYYTYGAELNQSKNITADVYKEYIDEKEYSFAYINNEISGTTIDVQHNSYYYAWYSQTDKEWYTQHISYSDSAQHEWDDYVGGYKYH